MSLSNEQRPVYEVKAGLFKALAHPIRIHALEFLCDGQEHTVSELQEHTGLESSHLSAHLAVLRRNHVVTSERRGSHVYYRIATDEIAELLGSARRFLTDVVLANQSELRHATSLPDLPTP